MDFSIAALGKSVVILFYDPTTETLVNAGHHTFAMEYYDGAFIKPYIVPVNGRPAIRTLLVLVSSEGFEWLDLHIHGSHYRGNYFPAVDVTARVTFVQDTWNAWLAGAKKFSKTDKRTTISGEHVADPGMPRSGDQRAATVRCMVCPLPSGSAARDVNAHFLYQRPAEYCWVSLRNHYAFR
ncbi:unnamed protein product, partial [Mesorhabditis spiculigera]